jgi:pimeloyl-ACP methyl ester carboxylesterase
MGHGTDVVTTGSVVSADGTRLGYRRLGRGPSVILLHGGANASQHMMRLGRALADAFTVYLPDRRGRGMSGTFGPAYSIQREDEDLAAMVEHTGAECVFGPANGGLFARPDRQGPHPGKQPCSCSPNSGTPRQSA